MSQASARNGWQVSQALDVFELSVDGRPSIAVSGRGVYYSAIDVCTRRQNAAGGHAST